MERRVRVRILVFVNSSMLVYISVKGEIIQMLSCVDHICPLEGIIIIVVIIIIIIIIVIIIVVVVVIVIVIVIIVIMVLLLDELGSCQ